MNIFSKANMKRDETEQIDYREFYNDEINNLGNIQEYYEIWQEQKRQ